MKHVRILAILSLAAAVLTAACMTEDTGGATSSSPEWTVVVDPETDQATATNGVETVALDNNAPQATFEKLVGAGLGEQQAYGWQAWACRAACVGLAAGSCVAIGFACAGATVVSVGGFLIPCTVAVTAACVGGAVTAQVCSDFCGRAFP